jgi:uncharacterized protein
MGAMLGLGGGIFLVPFLALIVGVPMHQAIATSIIAVIATSSAGAALNVERQTVNVRLGMLLETATVSGAIIGGITATMLSGAVLARIFSGILFLVASIMAWRSLRHDGGDIISLDGPIPGQFFDETSNTMVNYTAKRIPAAMLVSVLAGNVSGLLGVGGGIFKVPAMNLVCGIPMKAATATSNFMIGVTATASAFIYFSQGHVNPVVASSAVLGVLVGSFAGVWVGRRVNTRMLTWIFIGVLLFVAVELFKRSS